MGIEVEEVLRSLAMHTIRIRNVPGSKIGVDNNKVDSGSCVLHAMLKNPVCGNLAGRRGTWYTDQLPVFDLDMKPTIKTSLLV